MKLKSIFYVLVSLAFLITLITGVALDLITDEMRREFDQTVEISHNIAVSQEIAKYLGQATLFNGRWVLLHDENFLAQRDALRLQIWEDIAKAEVNATEPKTRQLLQDARGQITKLFAAQDEVARSEIRHLPPETLKPLSTLFDKATAALQRYTHQLNETLTQIRDQNIHYERISDLIARSAEAISLVLLIAGFWIFRTGLLRPMQRLLRAIVDFQNGRKETQIDPRKMRFREVRDAAAAFNSLTRSLNHLEQQRIEYLAGIAHDIRNPLTTINGLTEVLLTRGDSLEKGKVNQLLELIKSQSDRIGRLMTDWIDRQRIERGELSLKLSTVDIRKTVEHSVRVWREASLGHMIELKQPDQPLEVECDTERVEQVLYNLLSNAIKYSPKGGNITVESRAAETWIEILVTDSGLGISPEDLELLFEPFRRSGAVRDTIPGTGLGLSTSKKIIEAQGGRILAESTLGKGSTFRVRFPKP